MPCLVLYRLIEWTAANNLVLDLDKILSRIYITKTRRELACFGLLRSESW